MEIKIRDRFWDVFLPNLCLEQLRELALQPHHQEAPRKHLAG